MKTTSEIISKLIKDIRAARKHLSVPCIVGLGYTVSINDGDRNFQNLGSGEYNFAGSWYEGTYYSEDDACRLRDHIATENPYSKVTVHHIDDLARIQETKSVEMLRHFFDKRAAFRSLRA